MSDKFDYTYSAPTEEEKREIEAVRRGYVPEQNKQDAMSRMRALDKKVRRPAEIIAYVLGIIGTLVFGTGMCMEMEAIGGGLVAGIIVGIAGVLILAFNYKIHKAILNARKKKYGGEILKITEELLNGKNEKG